MKAFVSIYRTEPSGYLISGGVATSADEARIRRDACPEGFVQTVEFEVAENAVDAPSEVKEVA